MILSTNIRNLYTPVQPTVKPMEEKVAYSEFLPDPSLQSYIYCYWQLMTTQPLAEPFVYRVVADGCIDIFFELESPSENFVMGFCKKFTEFPLPHSFHYIGIRFLPTMFPQLFNINASELSNRYEHLKNVAPDLSSYIAQRFSEKQSKAKIKGLLDQYFLLQASRASMDDDPRLYEALTLILSKQGLVDVERELDTGLGPRQLRRLFSYYLGTSAKTFCQVVRFQHILRAKPSTQSLRQNKLFFDAGYYDQAHFIKEFKNFYGVTPAKAFGR